MLEQRCLNLLSFAGANPGKRWKTGTYFIPGGPQTRCREKNMADKNRG
jgi:hypothetical protein